MMKIYALAAALALSFGATPVAATPGDSNEAAASQWTGGYDGMNQQRSATSSSGEPLSPGGDRKNIAVDNAGNARASGGGDPNRAWPANRLRL
jgi:hypothetical protein